MANIVTCQAISKHFGLRTLFEDLSVSFADDERVGFIGPNGAGKTTFLKIIAGLEPADSGEVSRRRSSRIGYLSQHDQFDDDDTVSAVLGSALTELGLETHERDTAVSKTLGRFDFQDPERPVRELSGGWRKRLAIAKAVVQGPDLLLMDEPTNHLDIEGIAWLENYLSRAPFSFVAVSHDRYFLENVTTRVVELNPIFPEGYFSVSGNYSKFLEKRTVFLEAQQAQEESLANIVRREVAFLQSNSKAQRTKSKSRIEEAHRLKDELRDLSQRNARTIAAGIDFDSSGRKSRKLLSAEGLSKSLRGKLLFEDVSILLSPGVRIGLLGGNGSGKTTLIRTLMGDIEPDTGGISQAENLRVVLFDQQREQLPQDITLRRALAGKHDSVDFRGRNIHITAWAKKFLFSIDQLEMLVQELSGGEQARILIARLMLQPADVLILDEPTNDLDITSLDVLEESLTEFDGAVVLVTHDRFMLERVSTEILGLDGDGRVGRYGNCAQWQAARAKLISKSKNGSKAKKSKGRSSGTGLTATEKKELQDMEETILDAEARVEECTTATQDPAIGTDHVEAQKRWGELEAAKRVVEDLYARWEDLESRSS